MPADVRPLLREHKEPFAPVPEVVEQCYKLLQEAKSGNLRALAYATVRHDGLTEGIAAMGFSTGGSPASVFPLTHAIELLRRRWLRYCDGDGN